MIYNSDQLLFLHTWAAQMQDESLFYQLNQLTRNAEPQFSPRDDDWLTAYLVRGAQFHEEATRVTQCSMEGAAY